MEFAVNSRRIGAALLAVAITAVLLWFGYGLNPWWPLLWFAPLPVLLLATRSSWCSAAGTAFLSWFLGLLSLWHYLHAVLGIPIAACVVTLAMQALAFTLAVLLFRALLRRGSSWAALLAFPAAWVSVEYVHNLTSVHGTGGSLAYTQLNFLPILQLASITGPWGITFLVLLFPAAIAVGLNLHKTAPRQAKLIVATTFSVVAGALAFGAVRLASPPPPGTEVKVGLIASDAQGNEDVAGEGAPTARIFRDYANHAESLAAQGAQVIVLPEKVGKAADPDTRATDAIFQSLADKTGATIVAGMTHISPPLRYNEARIYAPGAAVRSYDKHHMLPPFESNLEPGTTRTLLPQPSGTWGVAICKDMDFTDLSRQYGKDGAGLMLVPAWDFFVDRTWHGHEAIMRGVESGFGIVRSAKGGYLTVSDNRGRVLAETGSDSAPFATLIANVPAVHDKTLYLLLGDWFAWLILATLAFTLAQLFRSRRSGTSTPIPGGQPPA